jgi:DNA-directed RNA polymerase specialized sigma24 family protein
MSSGQSVTYWLHQAQAGDAAAAQELWERYFQRLVALARKKLQGAARRAADEEDVALSAFDSFFRGAEQGRFPRLKDRHDLWRLLIVLTCRKAAHLVRHERRQRRGGGAIQGESAFLRAAAAGEGEASLEQTVGWEPSPAFAAQVAEEFQRLLDRLGDAELQQVALWKMEGYTTEEIAAKLSCVPRTVERKLRAIRTIWEHEEGEA